MPSLIVMSPADYQNWLARGRPPTTLVQSGERLFRELGCSGCHVGSSVVRAPHLQGVFGKPVPLNSGEVDVLPLLRGLDRSFRVK